MTIVQQALPRRTGTAGALVAVMHTGERLLTRLVEAVAAAIVLAETLILLTGVVFRFVLHAPLVWSDELASILFLWLAMLGSVIALQRQQHMRLTALVSAVSPRLQAMLQALAVGRRDPVPAPRRAARGRLRGGPVVHRNAGARLVRHDARGGIARRASR